MDQFRMKEALATLVSAQRNRYEVIGGLLGGTYRPAIVAARDAPVEACCPRIDLATFAASPYAERKDRMSTSERREVNVRPCAHLPRTTRLVSAWTSSE